MTKKLFFFVKDVLWETLNNLKFLRFRREGAKTSWIIWWESVIREARHSEVTVEGCRARLEFASLHLIYTAARRVLKAPFFLPPRLSLSHAHTHTHVFTFFTLVAPIFLFRARANLPPPLPFLFVFSCALAGGPITRPFKSTSRVYLFLTVSSPHALRVNINVNINIQIPVDGREKQLFCVSITRTELLQRQLHMYKYIEFFIVKKNNIFKMNALLRTCSNLNEGILFNCRVRPTVTTKHIIQ